MLRNVFIFLLLASAWSMAQEAPGKPDTATGPFISVDLSVPHPGTSQLLGDIPFVLDDGSTENGIGDNQPFLWFNRFTPNEGSYPFRLDQVEVFWDSAYMSVGEDFSLYIYEDADGDPLTGLDLLASYTLTVGTVDNFDSHDLPDGPILTGPSGDLIVAIVNRFGGSAATDFPAALDTTATQGRSWAGSYSGTITDPPQIPADNGFDTIDSFGFPGNWLIRASGTQVAEVPTLGQWGMFSFVVLLLAAGIVVIKKRR